MSGEKMLKLKWSRYRIFMHCDVIGVLSLFHVFFLTLFILSPFFCHQNRCSVLINFAHSFLEDLKFYSLGI